MRFWIDARGSAAVEFAIVAPLLLLMCVFAAQAGIALINYNRLAMVAETALSLGEEEAREAFGVGAEAIDFMFDCREGRSGALAEVTATYSAALMGELYSLTARSARAVTSCDGARG
jgi:hypothetical protein